MKVVCIKPNSKLIKGSTYKVVSYNNSNSSKSSYFRPTIRIYITENSIQVFPLQNFKPENSDTFPNIQWICPDYQLLLNERESTKVDENLKSGDYVIPLYDHLKTLIKGRKYKVEEVKIHNHKSSSGYGWTDIKIKLVGSNRFYTAWNFRKCTAQESREIGISQLFDERVDLEEVNKFKRKFDYFEDTDKIKLLLNFIIESSNDRYRHQMDIIDWAIFKSANKYKLTREDFELIKDLSLSEMLNILK